MTTKLEDQLAGALRNASFFDASCAEALAAYTKAKYAPDELEQENNFSNVPGSELHTIKTLHKAALRDWNSQVDRMQKEYDELKQKHYFLKEYKARDFFEGRRLESQAQHHDERANKLEKQLIDVNKECTKLRDEVDYLYRRYTEELNERKKQEQKCEGIMLECANLRKLLRECLAHIDLLEGHLPMDNKEDEAVYKESLVFSERVATILEKDNK